MLHNFWHLVGHSLISWNIGVYAWQNVCSGRLHDIGTCLYDVMIFQLFFRKSQLGEFTFRKEIGITLAWGNYSNIEKKKGRRLVLPVHKESVPDTSISHRKEIET